MIKDDNYNQIVKNENYLENEYQKSLKIIDNNINNIIDDIINNYSNNIIDDINEIFIDQILSNDLFKKDIHNIKEIDHILKIKILKRFLK